MAGTHAIGHTRMATESAVTPSGAHPFSTGTDQCLVHNGSLSNHSQLRRRLEREGVHFATENDSELPDDCAGFCDRTADAGGLVPDSRCQTAVGSAEADPGSSASGEPSGPPPRGRR